ncbi:MAG: UDP-N-acetylmuramoyl-L-alanyl-D-glutamate--2,6-diaminopimelate ligase [bacterium]
MRLSELIAGMKCRVYNFKDIHIESLEFDSRKVKRGSLFIALRGTKYDGHNFIELAEKQGAVAIAVEDIVGSHLPQIKFDDTREAMGKLAKRFYTKVSNLKIIGITGTNGKTTTAFLIYSVLKKANYEPGLIGTVYYLGKNKIKAERTTPESLDIFRLFNNFHSDGLKSVVMEVSSHALTLKRVEELTFEVGVFTNLSQDHLDFHKSLAEYKSAKFHLFDLLSKDGFAVFNHDDPAGREVGSLNIKNKLSFGFDHNAMIRGELVSDSISGLRMKIYYQDKSIDIDSKLIGQFNCYNILASFAVGVAMGIDYEAIKVGIESLKGVRGRMEEVVPNIFVDFAHTPGALLNVLSTLRKYTTGKLIVIFGCGGDRDREKRPQMGQIASANADVVIITSDNPRTEKPERIIQDIVSGIKNNNFKIIEERDQAIKYGIDIKKSEDVLLIAGKGHEEYQIIGDRVVPFDDAMIVRQIVGK